MTYSAYLLPPDARPTAQDYAGLSARTLNAVRDELGESCVVFSAQRDGRMGSFVLYLRTRDALFARTGGTVPDARGCYFAVDYHGRLDGRWNTNTTNPLRTRRLRGQGHARLRAAAPVALVRVQAAQADTYREVLALQSQSIERQLGLAGAPATPVPSELQSPRIPERDNEIDTHRDHLDGRRVRPVGPGTGRRADSQPATVGASTRASGLMRPRRFRPSSGCETICGGYSTRPGST